MILRRVITHFRKQEWTAIALDFVIVVVGVFIGIQVANWNEVRSERAAEERYLIRLFADTQANIAELTNVVDLHERRAAVLADLEDVLLNDGEALPDAVLQGTLCRFFVQPGATLQLGTYDELVASGALSILRDEELRILLSRQQTAQAEAARLDMLTPAIQRSALPLEDYREWAIIRKEEKTNTYGGVTCRFDVNGMRTDPRMPSVIAQLYRDQDVTKRFRADLLEITHEIDARLKELIAPQDIPATVGSAP